MAKKSAIHRLCKRLDTSPELGRAVDRIEQEFAFEGTDDQPLLLIGGDAAEDDPPARPKLEQKEPEKAEPVTVTAAAPTFADVMSDLEDAKTTEDIDVALDAARSLNPNDIEATHLKVAQALALERIGEETKDG